MPKEAFFSAQRGGAQLLPGGNVLIANTDSGNAFEVTPSGERVWEFFTDELKAGERAALYRMERFSSAEIEARLGPSVSQRTSISTSRSSPPAISAGLAGGMGRRAAVPFSD